MKLTYYSDVKDGKLQRNVSTLIAKELPSFNGKRVEITIQKLRSKRSVQQNRLWWLYMGILSKETGFSKEEMHEVCKYRFCRIEKVNEKTGEILPYLASTTALSKSDFVDLINELQKFASETFQITLPSPDEQINLFNDEEQ